MTSYCTLEGRPTYSIHPAKRHCWCDKPWYTQQQYSHVPVYDNKTHMISNLGHEGEAGIASTFWMRLGRTAFLSGPWHRHLREIRCPGNIKIKDTVGLGLKTSPEVSNTVTTNPRPSSAQWFDSRKLKLISLKYYFLNRTNFLRRGKTTWCPHTKAFLKKSRQLLCH